MKIKENSKKSKKKGCLIIILILFSFFVIIGVVGINMSQSFMLNAQIAATETNHENSKSYIAASIKKCSTGSTTITLGTTSLLCSTSLPELIKSFNVYLNSVMNNTFKADAKAFEFQAGYPVLGSSNIYYSGNNITIITNIGDEDGGDVYLNDIIVKE